MRVQIIEDDAFKLARIKILLDELGLLQKACVALSYNSGLRAIQKCAPDLVILDMALPTFDREPGALEGRARPLGGYDLMRKLKIKAQPIPVVILTALESFGEGVSSITREALAKRCEVEFPELFLGCIFYSATDDWNEELKSIVERVGRMGNG